jgi:CubicO group peptidase (beta-lactamase class C family)
MGRIPSAGSDRLKRLMPAPTANLGLLRRMLTGAHRDHDPFVHVREVEMTKRLSITLILPLLLFLLASTHQVYSQSLSSRIDDLVNEYVANHQFMGSVLVADKGEVVFSKGYGLADVESNIPNTPETKFMIGSITKQFTAVLIMQLIERGSLGFDDTISDFLPSFPKDIGDKITVEMLLGHTSGLPLPEGIEKYYYASQNSEFLDEFIKQLSEEGLRFEPGEGYGYSNAGYHILGAIVEEVTGLTYEEVLNEQILKPLGMSSTGCERKGLVLANRAHSYIRLPDQYVTWNEMFSFNPAVIGFGAGSMYSTVEDLFKFSKALSTNKLLSEEYMAKYLKMRTVKSRPPIRNIPDALATELFGTCGNGFVGEISVIKDPGGGNNETLYWHDGTWKLFKGFHYHYSNKGQYIIILSNCSLLGEGDEMALRIHQLLNSKPYEHIHIKRDLLQYIEEEVGMHAGVEPACAEYIRLKDDTRDFIVPGEGDFLRIARQVAERGDSDNAILILDCVLSAFPDSWKAYDGLAEIYATKGEKALAIDNCKKSLALNPENSHAIAMLKELEGE